MFTSGVEPIRMVDQNDDTLPVELRPLAVRAALEGIPVAAIGRVLKQELELVYNTLNDAKASGTITEVPRADWPPTGRNADHVPSVRRNIDSDDLRFYCQKLFKLTNLEAAFLSTLLRVDHADKTMLHRVVEEQRFKRPQQPDTSEITDPKIVDVMICKLRKKLKAFDKSFGNAIKTIWGGGYYIEAPVKALLMTALNGAKDGTQNPTSASPITTGHA